MMGFGLRRSTVALEPHNDAWEENAQQTICKLRGIMGKSLVGAQHIGSTAIKGICAKPIIDIVVGVSDFVVLPALNSALAENGFIARGQDLPEQYLYICGENDIRTHHIHIVKYGSEAWQNYLNLRDYLNCHPDDAQAYAALKASLAAKYPADRVTYTEMKSALIREILTKAAKWRADAQ